MMAAVFRNFLDLVIACRLPKRMINDDGYDLTVLFFPSVYLHHSNTDFRIARMSNVGRAVRQGAQRPIEALLPYSRSCLIGQKLFRPQGKLSRKGPRHESAIRYERILRREGSGRKGMVAFASEPGSVRAAVVDQDRTLWLRSAGTLLLGALGTNLTLAALSEKVLSLEHWQIAGLLFVTDCIFVATSLKYLQLAEDFDRDWHKSRKRYPGPAWGVKDITRDSNQAQEPFLFFNYVQLFLVMGAALPLLVTIYTCLTSNSGPVAAAVLPPYILTLIVQVWQENNFIKKKSALWPIVPMHHMGYRFIQLARGTWITVALQGPQYLLWMLTFLACLWFFNFGAVLTWQTSLYYWHRQPAFEDKELQ